MLRIIYSPGNIPFSFAVDPDSTFEAGMVGELKVFGNQRVCGVSSGLNPIGLIDENRVNAFSRAQIDEVVIAVPPSSAIGMNADNRLITLIDLYYELENPLIVPSSFFSEPVSVIVNERNGTLRIPAGTELNFSQTNSGTPDAVRTVVRYSHQIPNVVGEDSTQGSGMMTVWVTPGLIFQTDIYDTTQQYPLNALLYCGLDGKLTTNRISDNYPACAMVTSPGTTMFSAIEAKWLL